MSISRDPFIRCEMRAAKQHGVLSYEQAKVCGLPSSAIARRIRSGEWQRVFRTVFSLSPVSPGWHGIQMAACLHGGPGCVAAGAAAARLRRLPSFEKAGVEILAERDVRSINVRVHISSRPLPRPRIFAGPIPLERCDSMLVRIGARYPPAVVAQALDECWRRHMTDPDRLARFLEAEGRGARGASAIRKLLKERREWLDVTDSEMESLFLRLAERYRLVPEQSHVVIYDGAVRVKEVDFVYAGQKVAVELDSYKFHGGLDPFDKDREVDVVLGRLGWRVLRFTWRQLNEKPDWVFGEIRQALGIRSLPSV